MSQKHLINWFEIPTKDLDRARKFYETIFEIEMQPFELPELKMMLFPSIEGATGGALVHNAEFYTPTQDGRLLYMDANPSIQAVIDRIEPAGGKLLTQRTQIGEDIGYMALFLDTEGNRMALMAKD